MQMQDNAIGILLIIVGVVIVLFSIGDLFFRLALAFLGVMLINYGLKLRGQPPLIFWVQQFFFRL